MKMLQITAPHHAEWIDCPLPKPKAGEVLVRLDLISTCPHWDIHIMDGEPMFDGMVLTYPYTPGQPGHESTGHIVALGPGVKQWKIGQRVAAWRDRGLGVDQGCYAQFVAFDAQCLLAVPDHLEAEDVAPLELAMCLQVSFDQLLALGPLEGQRFGVGGLGPAGLIAIQLAKAYGVAEVVGFDPLPERRSQALELGADRALAPDPDQFAADRFADASLDVALDCTGYKSAIQFLMDRTRRALAIFGVLREAIEFEPRHRRGAFALLGYGEHNRGAAERAMDHIASGRIKLRPLIGPFLPLSFYAEGVELLRQKKAIKIGFLPWE